MPTEVFTEEWCHACCQALNARPGYATAGAEWRSPVVLQMGADPALGIEGERAVFLDLFEGVCRGARVATAEEVGAAPFVLRAEAKAWRRMLGGETDPVSAVMRGELRVERGNLMVLMKHAAAAREMLAAAVDAGGVFPA